MNETEDFLKTRKVNIHELEELINSKNKELEDVIGTKGYSSNEFINLNTDLNEYKKLLELAIKYESLLKNIEDSTALLSDPEMKELAETEIENSKSELDKVKFEILDQTKVNLPNDDKKAIMEFRPGVGGVEASLFAEDLYRMYLRYCNSKGYTIEQISLTYDDQGGIKEASFLVDKKGAFGEFRFESGVHRVQRVPKTESAGRIHTSTASIVVMPQFEKIDIKIAPEDLRIDVYRSSGPGGQSVNTTDSAVRITHIPTGITVSCQNGKSQHKNKEMALSILSSKLWEIEEEKMMSKEQKIRMESISGGDRSAKIRTYNFGQSRCTDHRITVSWFNLETIMQGEIDEIVKTVNNTLRSKLEE